MKVRNFCRALAPMDGQIADFHLKVKWDNMDAAQLDPASGHALEGGDQTLVHQRPERIRGAVPAQAGHHQRTRQGQRQQVLPDLAPLRLRGGLTHWLRPPDPSVNASARI